MLRPRQRRRIWSGSDASVSTVRELDIFEKSIPRHNYVFLHAGAGIPKKRHHHANGFSNGFANKEERKPLAPPIEVDESRFFGSVQVGEDSFYHRADSLGVADGVGGWHGEPHASPALYARMLMHYAYLELEKYDNIECDEFADYFNVEPVEILQRSYENTRIEAKKMGIVGSSTACIAILRDDELRIANLGDCGVSVIRQNDFIFRSEEQQHSFNYPYQLGTYSTDTPRDAQTFRVKVQKGDIVIVASDGIYDNLFNEDILEEVVKHIGPNNARPYHKVEPQILCDALAHRAQSVSQDTRNLNSPFQERAMQQGIYYQGGKADDISVLVGIVLENEDTPDRRL
ncbi:uncharacterized protein VTP21DRAFT_1301 [Calcarisporiella thermophila]|uniref:uncharacterized protein n=1 Tax=Calcarisporiella thermophila TaxID=911321 RepID=UPI0037444A27